jgi:saccharopine dehydrogenase-like NADP-dependent oxidoreductase
MAVRMEHTKNDRDLVVMRHNFVLENQKKERWGHTSTWIESGFSKASGGYSLMSKSVGVTAGIGARLVLEGKIKRHGIVTPMYADVYDPILKILDSKFGIAMFEESDRPDGLPTSTRAKL